MDDAPELTIGQVARRAGVATSAIRYYESIGLLSPPDRVSGQRRYHPDVLGQLAFIGIAQSAGFTLREIRDLVAQIDGGGMAVPMRSMSKRKLGEVEALLERTRAMKTWLDAASQCECRTPDECTLFDADGSSGGELALQVVHVDGDGCRRQPPG